MNNKEKIFEDTSAKDLDENEKLSSAFPTNFSNLPSGIIECGNIPHFKTLRMEIAIEAMKSLLAKDFKNIGFSAFNNSKQNPAQYIADQSFILADAMIERENKKEDKDV